MHRFPSIPKAMRNSSLFSRITSGAPTRDTVRTAGDLTAAETPVATVTMPINHIEIIFIE
jgi:hypothetical protein